MSIRVRFAPSPTGLLHAGNARTAVLNFLIARKEGGAFILRIDDTDPERSKPEFERQIVHDLDWLGLTRDMFARQSEREALHNEAAEKLKSLGRLYPCYETPDELERKRKRLGARGLPPVYDRAGLKLSAEERAALEASGRAPHWRFALSQKPVVWNDEIRGRVEIDTASVSDPVLIRADGRFLYTLPSVADDIEMGITHIVRGEDHVTNTATQIEIFDALGAKPPLFAHHPLLIGVGGEALSKRLGSLSLQHMRTDGIEPLALTAYLAKIGTSDTIEPRLSMDELAAEFSFEKIGRAPARFDPAELATLNAKLLHLLPYEVVKPHLVQFHSDLGPAFWEAVKANLTRMGDVSDLKLLVTGPVEPLREDPEFLVAAAGFLPEGVLTGESWGVWTKAVAAGTGRKGRGLFHPLRLALTGREHGPELAKLLPLIGRERVLARLMGETA
jgi:glutamyl-tRNA synthetase